MPAAIAIALLAGSATGCADAVTESSPRYLGAPVVQGGQCFARTRDGRLVRVSPSRCPELRQPVEDSPGTEDEAPSE